MMKLRFTQLAKTKYEGLTGSQRKFVDDGLDQLKQGKGITREIENKELGLTIICESIDDVITIKDISYDAYRQTGNYKDAQKRMDDWNN